MQLDQIGGLNANLAEMKGTLRFRVSGVGGNFNGVDPFEVVADFARNNVPPTAILTGSTLYLQDIQIDERSCGREYELTCPYSALGVVGRSPGAFQISIDNTGGTVHVKAGRRIAGFAVAPDKMIDNGGLIGVQDDDVLGTDIPVGDQSRITVMFRCPQGMLNRNFIMSVGALVGYPNADQFMGFPPGTMMYRGGNFTQTESEATSTFNFEYSAKLTNFSVGPITGITKDGWDVFSYTYEDAKFNNGVVNVPVKKLKCIEVIRPAGREWRPYVSAFGFGG